MKYVACFGLVEKLEGKSVIKQCAYDFFETVDEMGRSIKELEENIISNMKKDGIQNPENFKDYIYFQSKSKVCPTTFIKEIEEKKMTMSQIKHYISLLDESHPVIEDVRSSTK